MHCNMSVGSSVPSPTAKSCNYDTDLERLVCLLLLLNELKKENWKVKKKEFVLHRWFFTDGLNYMGQTLCAPAVTPTVTLLHPQVSDSLPNVYLIKLTLSR